MAKWSGWEVLFLIALVAVLAWMFAQACLHDARVDRCQAQCAEYGFTAGLWLAAPAGPDDSKCVCLGGYLLQTEDW